jgi:EAL domain-containing protein (putative c-di-GMP-specific phosphodiesterase class I)/GGDEF domain-containing protein
MDKWRKIKVKIKFHGLADDKIKKIEDIISNFFYMEKPYEYSNADIVIADYKSISEISERYEKKKDNEEFPPIVLISTDKVNQDDIMKLGDLIGDIIKDVLSFSDIEKLPLVIKREISQRKSIRLKDFHIRRLQTHDIVSDFPTRLTFLYEVENILKDADEKNKFAMFVIRINSLDILNSFFGEDLSNKIVDFIAEEIRKASHHEDIIGRASFKNFAIFRKLNDENYKEEALNFARALINNLTKHINYQGLTFKVSPSIGISFFPSDSYISDRLLSFAERAAEYLGKITEFSEISSKEIIEEGEILSEILNALLKKELFLVYQPIFKIEDMKPEGFEALLRWKGKRVNPEKVITLAEKTGLIDEVLDYIFERVFEVEAKLKKYNFAINISPRHLIIPEITELMEEKANRFGIEPEKIYLEITEKSTYSDIIRAKNIIKKLKEKGFNFSIDDFGSGQSSISILSEIPFEILKIDKNPIENFTENELSILLIKSVIDTAHTKGKKVVAEGIEKKEDLEKAESLGCDMVQGFLLAKPLSQEEILRRFG